ncbi:hypothetical protein AB1L30_05460 [Bremerella sp. JC817]|uniref:hypothetical protein n=1 Tax=Bremerella sp. JC817 TaxID=3231756 RepID=UPI0034581FB8
MNSKLSSLNVGLLLVALLAGLLVVGRLVPTTTSNLAPAKPSLAVQPKPNDPPSALFGYQPRPAETRRFLQQLPKANIRQAAPGLFQAAAAPHDVFLYRALYRAHQQKFGQPWQVGRQGIGDCVSWGWAHGADIHLAVMWSLGDSADWKPVATESIYGGSRVEARGVARGGWSDGSYGAAAARWVREYGLIFREPYDQVDLSTYSAKRAKDWGNYGNGGKDDDGQLDDQARQHPVRNVALVTNFDEAAAAIASGYPVPVCSNQGFASKRDADGFARPSGTWPHCMCFVAVRHGDRPGLLCLNSWGPNWIEGPKWPDDMPDGSFWVEKSVVDRMLAGEDSFCVSGYDGFPFRELDHALWVQVELPLEVWQPAAESDSFHPEYALAP